MSQPIITHAETECETKRMIDLLLYESKREMKKKVTHCLLKIELRSVLKSHKPTRFRIKPI